MRLFDLGDVLSIATGKVLSRRYNRAMYDVVSYMWGQPCDHFPSYFAMYPECMLWLLKQYPKFGELEFLDYVAVLDRELAQAEKDGIEAKSIVFKWVDEMVVHYGERLPVGMIPDSHLRPIDPVEEAELIMGPGRIIPI